jgi:hypothetical protein
LRNHLYYCYILKTKEYYFRRAAMADDQAGLSRSHEAALKEIEAAGWGPAEDAAPAPASVDVEAKTVGHPPQSVKPEDSVMTVLSGELLSDPKPLDGPRDAGLDIELDSPFQSGEPAVQLAPNSEPQTRPRDLGLGLELDLPFQSAERTAPNSEPQTLGGVGTELDVSPPATVPSEGQVLAKNAIAPPKSSPTLVSARDPVEFPDLIVPSAAASPSVFPSTGPIAELRAFLDAEHTRIEEEARAAAVQTPPLPEIYFDGGLGKAFIVPEPKSEVIVAPVVSAPVAAVIPPPPAARAPVSPILDGEDPDAPQDGSPVYRAGGAGLPSRPIDEIFNNRFNGDSRGVDFKHIDPKGVKTNGRGDGPGFGLMGEEYTPWNVLGDTVVTTRKGGKFVIGQYPNGMGGFIDFVGVRENHKGEATNLSEDQANGIVEAMREIIHQKGLAYFTIAGPATDQGLKNKNALWTAIMMQNVEALKQDPPGRVLPVAGFTSIGETKDAFLNYLSTQSPEIQEGIRRGLMSRGEREQELKREQARQAAAAAPPAPVSPTSHDPDIAPKTQPSGQPLPYVRPGPTQDEPVVDPIPTSRFLAGQARPGTVLVDPAAQSTVITPVGGSGIDSKADTANFASAKTIVADGAAPKKLPISTGP